MGLSPLFDFTWQVDPAAETVIPPDGRDGDHLSDGTGRATGGLSGTMRFSMYTGDCPLDPGYLDLPEGQPRASGDHVCTVNPGALLETGVPGATPPPQGRVSAPTRPVRGTSRGDARDPPVLRPS